AKDRMENHRGSEDQGRLSGKRMPRRVRRRSVVLVHHSVRFRGRDPEVQRASKGSSFSELIAGREGHDDNLLPMLVGKRLRYDQRLISSQHEATLRWSPQVASQAAKKVILWRLPSKDTQPLCCNRRR